jgi:cytochrome b
VGYGLLALLLLRLLWGVIGSRSARFSSFPPSLARAAGHLGHIRRGERVPHSSHNPLGALMAYAVWGCLAVIIATGVAMSGPPPANPNAVEVGREDAKTLSVRHEGEEYEEGEGESAEIFEELHEIAVNILYALIALHLLGVIFETRRSGREIVGAMLPGGNRNRNQAGGPQNARKTG